MMVAGVWSDDSALQLEATTQFRKLLSIGISFICLLGFVCVISRVGKADAFSALQHLV